MFIECASPHAESAYRAGWSRTDPASVRCSLPANPVQVSKIMQKAVISMWSLWLE